MFSDLIFKERFCERCIPQPEFARPRERVMGTIREPPDHRFLAVLELLDDFLPLKSVINIDNVILKAKKIKEVLLKTDFTPEIT